MIKNIQELNEDLLKTYEQINTGETTSQIAQDKANLAGKVLAGYKLRMVYNRTMGKSPEISFFEI
jgi:hypothetical protein